MSQKLSENTEQTQASVKADEGLDYLDKKKKKRVGWWLLAWFIMPFTAFLKLDELLSSDDDPQEVPPEPDSND